jgi:hypothetical protein
MSPGGYLSGFILPKTNSSFILTAHKRLLSALRIFEEQVFLSYEPSKKSSNFIEEITVKCHNTCRREGSLSYSSSKVENAHGHKIRTYGLI